MAGEQRAQVKQIGGTAPAAKQLAPLKRGDASLFELSGNLWMVKIHDDVTAQELEMHPTFWNMLGDDVHEGDEIQARWMKTGAVARYVVVNVANSAVAVRLAYAVEGAPLVSAIGPRPFPAGYSVVKSREDLPGFIVVRESDGMKIMNSGGVPWKSYQDAFEQFPKHAIFASDSPARYVP